MMQRSLNGISGDHFSFPTAPGDLNMISAIGNSVQLSYHKSRTGGKITLIPTKKDACICQPKSKTYISYMNSSTQEFHYDCLDHPRYLIIGDSQCPRHHIYQVDALRTANYKSLIQNVGLITRRCLVFFYLTLEHTSSVEKLSENFDQEYVT